MAGRGVNLHDNLHDLGGLHDLDDLHDLGGLHDPGDATSAARQRSGTDGPMP
jgi:hypothetical protein